METVKGNIQHPGKVFGHLWTRLHMHTRAVTLLPAAPLVTQGPRAQVWLLPTQRSRAHTPPVLPGLGFTALPEQCSFGKNPQVCWPCHPQMAPSQEPS